MPRNNAAPWLLPGIALLVGILGMSAVWVMAAIMFNRPCSWLALLAALDMAFLLRLTGAPTGPARVIAAAVATALAVSLSQWLIVSTQLGFALGLGPMDSALRLGPSLAWQLTRLSLDQVDWVWLMSSLPLAAILAQPWRSARSEKG